MRLQAADYSTAARLMEQTVEQFWLRGEAATMARWVLALPERLAREHARLLLTTALYLLNTVVQTHPRAARKALPGGAATHGAGRSRLAGSDRTNQPPRSQPPAQMQATSSGRPRAAEHALLQWRLRLLRRLMAVIEATASGDFERLRSMQEVIEEAQDHDEEAIWQTVPLGGSFTFHYTVRREGAQFLPRLLSVKERVSREASRFASIRVRQWLALSAVRAGQLRLASEESQEALDLIEHMQGFALLKGYLRLLWRRCGTSGTGWRRRVSCCGRSFTTPPPGSSSSSSAWGYAELIQVELARRDRPAAELALHEVEQLVQRERFGIYPGWLPAMQAQWWLAQGQLEAASRVGSERRLSRGAMGRPLV